MGKDAANTRLRAQMAVMSIFRDLGVPVADGLPIAEIEALWPEYGIRADDLSWAVEELVRDGRLARDAKAPDRLVLTQVGEQWSREQPSWLEYRLLVLRAAHARTLRRPGRRQPRPDPRRRRGDRATPVDGAS